MSRYFVPITQPQIRNSLLDFSPVNQGLNAIGEAQQNASRNALMRDQMAMQKDQQQWTRDRAEKQDARLSAEQGGKMAMAIMQMQDGDPAKATAWQKYLQQYGDGNHSPEELDPRTGPKIAAAAFGYADNPMERQTAQARLDLLRAQTARANRPDQGPDAPSNVREWQYYQSLPKEQQAEYLRLRRPSENRVVGDSIINRGTGEIVSNVGDQLQAGEMRKVQGKNDADFAKAFPKVQQSFLMFEDKSQRLEDTIDRAITRIGPLTAGAGAVLANLPATEARALRGDLDTIRANVGFEELQAMRDASPTGGALGQVSEMENRLLQSIRAAIDQFQAGSNVKTNLMIIKDSVRQLRDMKRRAYEADAARMGGSQAQPAVQMGQPQQRRTIDAGDGFTVEY